MNRSHLLFYLFFISKSLFASDPLEFIETKIDSLNILKNYYFEIVKRIEQEIKDQEANKFKILYDNDNSMKVVVRVDSPLREKASGASDIIGRATTTETMVGTAATSGKGTS